MKQQSQNPLPPQYLERLRAGDQALFAELVRDHHHALVALSRQFVGSADAEEIVQNAWIKAYQAIAGFEGRSGVRTWLSRIVINEARMWLRRQGREVALEDIGHGGGDALADRFSARGQWLHPPVEWHADSPDSLLTGDELAECLEKLLESMPPNQRSLLEMRDSAGLSFDVICNELAVSASNARVLLHRARGQLFKLVDHYQETGEC